MSLRESIVYDNFLDDLFAQELDAVMSDEKVPAGYSMWEDDTPPVSIQEFIESPDFLGLGDSIYPVIKENLYYVTHPDIREAIMLLGKSSGKTTTAQIFLLYEAYRLLCMRNPQQVYGLLPDTPIALLIVSVSEKQAKSVAFAGIRSMIDRSPWFKGKFEPTTMELRFPKHITLYSGHSGSTAFLGFNTIAALIDEVEWMVVGPNGATGSSVASKLYRALKGSLITRYPNDYKLLMISSPKDETSFLWERYKDIRMEGEQVDIPYKKPRYPKGETYGMPAYLFDELKNLGVNAYRYKDTYAINGPTWLINPKTPLSTYADDFISMEIESMRDYAAIPVATNSAFFKNPNIILDNADPMLENPIDPDTLEIADWFRPDPMRRYFMALDLSVRYDRTGVAMLSPMYDQKKVMVEFAFGIRANGKERIDYLPIFQLILNLRNRGFHIQQVNFDQFNSNSFILSLREQGINAKQVNYAESLVGLSQLHEYISTGKLIYGENPPLFKELQELIVVNARRIDHPSGGSKDIVDAVVNALIPSIEDLYNYADGLKAKHTAADVASKMLADKKRLSVQNQDFLGWV